MTQLEIPKGEIGQIRLFAVNRPIDELARDLRNDSKEALIADLLGRPMPEGAAELFPVSDLTGVGLASYLGDGYAVPREQISRDRDWMRWTAMYGCCSPRPLTGRKQRWTLAPN